jgi:hypothetical protein
MFSAHLEGKLVVGLLVHGPYFLDQSDHVHPFEIVRRWISEQGFERAQVCAVYCPTSGRGRLLSPSTGCSGLGYRLPNVNGHSL